MNKSLLAKLSVSERALVAETEVKAMAGLSEDEVAALHERVRRARNKYVGLYRRGGAAKVRKTGSRAVAGTKNEAAAIKAEAFEEALGRVSVRLAAVSRANAAGLKADRLEAARAAKAGQPAKKAAAAPKAKGRTTATTPRGDRALRSPATEKRRGATRAIGDRRQAKRDSR
jgi:hypothetical protein